MSNEATASKVECESLQAAAAIDDGGAGPAAWLLCRAATHLCGIPIKHVIEIMRALPIEAVSGTPRYVRGLCIIRGAPVPVVDTGLLLADQPTAPSRLVCIRTGDKTIALVAEDILGIRTVGADNFKELPALLRDAAAETIAAVGTVDAELLFVLRTARIVPEGLFDRLDIARAVA